MGCCESRDLTRHDGYLHFVTNEEYKKITNDDGKSYVPLDCSIDSNTKGAATAAEDFKFHRVPLAMFFNLDKYISKETPPLGHRLPSREEICTHLRDLGIGKETPVLCYDGQDGLSACRVASYLTAYGVKDVSVLNC